MKRLTFRDRLIVAFVLAGLLGWGTPSFAAPDQVRPIVSPRATPAAAPGSATPVGLPDQLDGTGWNAVDCATFKINAVVAAAADCGYITVPENRVRTGSRDIHLAVVRINSETGSKPPIFIGTGGPGGEGFLMLTVPPDALDIVSVNAPLLADRDLVFFTQRGTLDAVPFLGCPEYDPVESGFATAKNGWSRAQTDAELETTLVACRDRFIAEGADLGGYNSDENAADVNDVRAALGYDTIVFYGQSYGTQLAQFVMRTFPETLEAVILDGMIPVSFPSYARSNNIPGSFQRLFDACAADAACHAAYPDPMQTLTDVVAAFNADPLPVQVTLDDGTPVTLTIGGNQVLDYLFMLMGIGPPTNAAVMSTIDQLNNDPEPLLAAMAPSPASTSARLMQYAVNCSDDPSTSLDEFGLDTVAPVFRDFIYADAIKFVEACTLLDLPRLLDASDAPVTTDVPVLILNGGLDPATAPGNGDLVAASLPNQQSVLFPGGGHIQWPSDCAVSLIAAFLTDPDKALDTRCSATPPVFDVPFTARVTDPTGEVSLSIDLGAGWREAGTGYWSNRSGLTLVLTVLPAGSDPTAALVEGLAPITGVEPSEVHTGESIAGHPSQTVRLDTSFQGQPVALDGWAFATDDAVCRILIIGEAPTFAAARDQYPALLDTVQVTP